MIKFLTKEKCETTTFMKDYVSSMAILLLPCPQSENGCENSREREILWKTILDLDDQMMLSMIPTSRKLNA